MQQEKKMNIKHGVSPVAPKTKSATDKQKVQQGAYTPVAPVAPYRPLQQQVQQYINIYYYYLFMYLLQ